MERAKIYIRGVVQGVGMRPFVFNLARSMGLKGYVLNSTGGLTVDVEGEGIGEFINRLTSTPPPLSEIKEVEISVLPSLGYESFEMKESLSEGGSTLVPPDIATCPDCLREILDEGDRRHGYPFTNCTNCGPRYTITRGLPYDRKNTTMERFRMCPECEAEYLDPGDRRFHAQPNACPECGPRLKLISGGKEYSDGPLEKTIGLLKEGNIVAIKGIGGFHLAADAESEKAVRALRERKRKNNKPFAIMLGELETVREFCEIDEDEERLLLSPQRPIVLLRKKDGSGFRAGSPLAPSVSPNNRHIGVMLPYTPLHHLLLRGGNFKALVMTSGNLSEEPIVIDNEDAINKLNGIADAFLTNDRDIYMRADDSVAFLFEGKPRLLRRSRGLVPTPVELPIGLEGDSPGILAVGGELKNTFCIAKGKYAVMSQHIGDMENQETAFFFEETLGNIKNIYGAEPAVIAHDMHPDYMTTKWALGSGLKTIAVQHHHAHIASCMADNGLEGRVIGIAFDGTGYGQADNILGAKVWGGEFMTADLGGFRREGHFKYVPMPGGDTAAREPWRMAVSYVSDAFGKEANGAIEELGFLKNYGQENIENILRMIDKKINSPLTSSAGRLFDAVSAMLGLCGRATFEAEAAMALEAEADENVSGTYPVDITASLPMQVDFSLTIISIVNDLRAGTPKAVIAGKFHNTLAEAAGRVAERISGLRGLNRVALGGGVFQNRLLLKKTLYALRSRGLDAYIHSKVPPNDGGLSLGQAAIAAYRIKNGKS